MSAALQLECTPNDWPESVAELRTIDNLLRCSICLEYFNTAVTIPECSHNYCSLCIRRSLNYETQCPTCSTKATERDLKNNRVLDQLVKSFTKIRETLLEVVRGHCYNTCKTPKKFEIERKDKKRENTTSPEETAITKKRKRMKLENKELESSDAPVILVDTKSCSLERDSSPSTSEMADLVLIGVKTPAHTKKKSACHVPESLSPQGNASSDVAFCPVCGETVLERTINSHLDACLLRSERKETLRNRKLSSQKSESQNLELKSSPVEMRKLPAMEVQDKADLMTVECSSSSSLSGSNSFINPVKKRKTLPKLVFALLNDKQLRKKLREYNLSTHGTRETLIKRYQEFVIIYNSQCDSMKPKSVEEIARQVEKQEKTKLKLSLTRCSNVAAGKNHGEEEKEKNRVQYLKENEEQFQQLISDIRKRDKGKKIRAKKTRETVTDVDAEKQSESTEENSNLSHLPNSLETRVTTNTSQKILSSSRSSQKSKDGKDDHIGSCDDDDDGDDGDGDDDHDDDDDERILEITEDSRSIKSFSIVPEPPPSSNLESLGDDESDSNSTPSLGLGSEEESDEDDNMEESENESSPSLLLQSSFDAPDEVPESPVIGCSKAGPGTTNSNRDIYAKLEQLTNQKKPPRSKKKLELKNSYR